MRNCKIFLFLAIICSIAFSEQKQCEMSACNLLEYNPNDPTEMLAKSYHAICHIAESDTSWSEISLPEDVSTLYIWAINWVLYVRTSEDIYEFDFKEGGVKYFV
jgi:hypothetical protein